MLSRGSVSDIRSKIRGNLLRPPLPSSVAKFIRQKILAILLYDDPVDTIEYLYMLYTISFS